MRAKPKLIFFFFSILFSINAGCWNVLLQSTDTEKGLRIKNQRRSKVSLNFETINNLVIIPARINGSDTLKFILDTGAGYTLITELGRNQSLDLNYEGDISIQGLGSSEAVPALISNGNRLVISGIRGYDQSVIVLLENVFNLSSFMGIQVNGLMGYDIFSNFIVEVDYNKEKVRFHNIVKFQERYEELKSKSDWYLIPVEIDDKKLYLNAEIIQSDSSKIKTRLVVDSGASHGVFLYPETSDKIQVPKNTIDSYLGTGLAGDIEGEIGKAYELRVGQIKMGSPVISFPDSKHIEQALKFGNRNGSIGSEFLRRFTVIYNYSDSTMLLKPNRYFREKFTYNTSGIEITTPYLSLPYYVVSKIREDSPAEVAGIKEGDIIIEIGYKKVYEYTLDEIRDIFQGTSGNVRVLVDRNNKNMSFDLELIDSIKLDNEL